MCVSGKPTANNKFRGGTLNTTGNSVLYAGITMSTQKIRVTMDKDGTGAVFANAHPFPFQLGQFFNLTFALVDADHTYSMAINGLEFLQRRSVQAISEVVETYFNGDLEMDYVNVWCL
ncbi:hypothetical protein V1264_001386 [Littorina saxatilis]|uniref:Galectin n=2 Tax=Littorina saxatilis TaxID=31220 RepID=A0AAN9C6Z8_9CAEN